MWNTLEEDDMKPLLSIVLPSIKTAQVIYLPKLLSSWNSSEHSMPFPADKITGDTMFCKDEKLFDAKYICDIGKW
jgi:hypothetical protein